MANSNAISVPPYGLAGSGLTQTLDVGGFRMGVWSSGGFSPTSYVQTSVMTPAGQLSMSPMTYAQLQSTTPSPATTVASGASPISTQSPVLWVVLACLFLGTMMVLKRKGKIK